MKYIISAFALLALLTTNPVFAAGETKEVCKDAVGKDGKAIKNKDGSIKQTCKKIKVHKKVEGTKVPEKSKK
jgi:hypothetical protein